MRLFTIISFSLFLNSSCFGQTKEQKFKSTVEQVVSAFARQDSLKLKRFINKEIGVYQLDRIGVFDHFNHLKSISFSKTTYPQVLFNQSKNVKLLTLQYSTLPMFSCDKGAWSKKGLFVDTTKRDHLLSKICKDRNKNVPDSIPAKAIRFFYDLENRSRRIVLNDNSGAELVFYLSYINKMWFLTIIDNVSSDCSV
jgi:transcription initiation factor TFIIIB Brf1 subunit/transcription initiation factor TFIIB